MPGFVEIFFFYEYRFDIEQITIGFDVFLDLHCSADQFFCYKSRVYVSNTLVCDDKKDCPQGEDEQNCCKTALI